MQTFAGKRQLITATLSTLRSLFLLKKVNLLDIFKSPALQIPIFWYFAMDLRKVIEGENPALAQQLVDSSFFWISDLTEPDPLYCLPLATGALLYLNVEVAVGRKSLSGETTSQSNLAKFLKDAFQTLAIFMPCFMAQQPSGIQVYLATSMVFTLLQSNAMRNDHVRSSLGLPPMNTKPKAMHEGEYMKEFLDKMSARQAAKAKGGFVLGEGVSVLGAQISVPRFGKKRKSSIVVETKGPKAFDESQTNGLETVEFEVPDYSLKTGLMVFPDLYKTTPVPFLEGMREPAFHARHQSAIEPSVSMPEIPLSVMEAANRGEKPEKVAEMAPKEILLRQREARKKHRTPIDTNKLKSKWNRKKGRK